MPPLQTRLAQLRRDLDGLLGLRRPPPAFPRDGSAWATTPSTSPAPTPSPRPLPTSTPSTVAIALDGERYTLSVPPGATVLAAAHAAGIPLPSSCAVGGCGTCRVRVVSGEIAMDEPNCLTPEERADGWALTCVGRPTGPAEIAR